MVVDDIRNKITLGRAILFCGAGFSWGSKNVKRESPCMAKALAKQISNLGGFGESENLMYASDRFLMEVKKYDALIDLLKRNYSICDIDEAHKNVCSYPWRRIYTTNYDDCIEVAGKRCFKDIESLTIDDAPADFYRRNGNCVHINGTVHGLTKEKLKNGTIKLTKSSYLSSSTFESSDWYQPFKTDLQNANVILFIGYSLYDLPIEKILFDQSYNDKTFFVTSPDESEELMYQLSKYGKVITDGVIKFGRNLGFCTFSKGKSELSGSIIEYELGASESKPISDEQIRNFFLTGDLNKSFYADFILGSAKKNYLVKRVFFDNVVKTLSNGTSVVVHSSFANGKSVFLEQIKCKLALNGKRVFEIAGPEEYLISDFDLISKDSENIIIVIDRFSKYLYFLDYIIAQNRPNVVLLIADKTGLYESYRKHLKNYTFYDYSVDYIDDDSEIYQMIDIIDNLGGWGNRTSYGRTKKKKYIKEGCLAEISTILLDIFKSPLIKNSIEQEITPLLSSEAGKKTIAAMCLLSVMDLPLTDTLVNAVSENELIYDYQFKNSPAFKLFFKRTSRNYYTVSSILCVNILKTFFVSGFLSSFLLKIAHHFDILDRRWSRDYDTIFKSVLKFSFVEQVFPEIQKEQNLIAYYGNLKNEVKWLQSDDHFWLQYGMAEMNANHLESAEQYLKTAYAFAHAKHYAYKTYDIDTQFGRLILLNALTETDTSKIVEKIKQANGYLLNVPNDHYRDRQLVLYEKLYETKFSMMKETEKIVTYKEFMKMKTSVNSQPKNPIRCLSRNLHDDICSFFERFSEEQKDLRYFLK